MSGHSVSISSIPGGFLPTWRSGEVSSLTTTTTTTTAVAHLVRAARRLRADATQATDVQVLSQHERQHHSSSVSTSTRTSSNTSSTSTGTSVAFFTLPHIPVA